MKIEDCTPQLLPSLGKHFSQVGTDNKLIVAECQKILKVLAAKLAKFKSQFSLRRCSLHQVEQLGMRKYRSCYIFMSQRFVFQLCLLASA